jgi:hypothetical protein
MERYLLALEQCCKQDGAGHRGSESQGGALPDASSSSPALKLALSACSLGGRRNTRTRVPSINDMLKQWEGNEDISDGELQLIKWTELATFFTGPGRGEICEIAKWLNRGNVEDWVSHYWFRGASPEELGQRSPNEKAELAGLVDLVLDNMGLAGLREGRNPGVQPHLINSDPLPVLHRPLAVYALSSLLCPRVTTHVMSMMGFRRERIGGLSYWHRPPLSGVDAAADVAGTAQMPLVVVHGLGAGLMPYFLFVRRLAMHHSGDVFVPEFSFLAMQPWLSVPSAREVVAQLTDMLKAHGHTAAHFAGHSFGAVVVGWILKMSPSSVLCMTLLDPACFLMMKAETCIKVLYGQGAQSSFELFCEFFCFRELFTVNLICRNFFWEQSTLWPEDLIVPSVIVLSSDDHIVPGLFIRRLLDHERRERKQQRKQQRPLQQQRPRSSHSSADVTGAQQPGGEPIDILWCEGFQHGEILLRPRSQDKLFSKMRGMAQHIHEKAVGKD